MRTVMMTAMTMMPAGPKPPLSFIFGFSAGPLDPVFLFSSDEASLSLWGTPVPFLPSSCKNYQSPHLFTLVVHLQEYQLLGLELGW